MQGELNIALGVLVGFALTLTRFVGMFVFLPWPGAQAGPHPARIVFAMGCTLALRSLWPPVNGVPTISQTLAWVAGEVALGMLIGVSVAWLSEIFSIGVQTLSVQAGYSYASTFDPNTQADSGILQVFAQLLAGMLFFATGLDGHVLRLLAASLESMPAGSFALHPSMGQAVIRIGADVFALAMRIALPLVGLLFLVDLMMGVLGRVNAQMQVITLTMPVKMLIAIVVLGSVLHVFPTLYTQESSRIFGTLNQYVRATH
jgi:flagellar biosynthesis protein FliR